MKNSAFTIMEVIVAVIIVGILAVVTVSLSSNYIMNAKMTELLTLASYYDNRVQELVLRHGLDTNFLNELTDPGNTFEGGKYFSATGIGVINTNPSYFVINFSVKFGVYTIYIASRYIFEDGTKKWYLTDPSSMEEVRPWIEFLKRRLPSGDILSTPP